MRLFIAEKPSVAKAIIAQLGVAKRGTPGFAECNGGNVVTWCFGHLLEQAEPDEYLPDDIPVNKKGKKLWRMQDLPIFPKKWILKVKNDKGVRSQLKTIKTLLAKATTVVNCGDPDREGQLLVDEILEFYGNKKPVQRFWVSAQDPTSIKRGLQNLQDNRKFHGMKLAAQGRSQADWLIGMNLTRALTLANASKKQRELIAVGRVQTPTLALVVQRDKTIKNFKPKPFFNFEAVVSAANTTFSARWIASDTQPGLDEEGRLISVSEASKLAQKLSQVKRTSVESAKMVLKKSAQPKGYSLADIQMAASEKFGFSAQETLDTCQSLYETHKIASYPRSDCQYLPESQFNDGSAIISAIASTCPSLKGFCGSADLRIKTAIWDDKKITAHHAIIPTQQKADWGALNDKEKKIYELISRRYLAQFYPVHEYLENTIDFSLNEEHFQSKGKTVKSAGWKALYGTEAETADADSDSEKDSNQKLPQLKEGQELSVLKVNKKELMTKPPQAFTEGTLIAAMERIHSVVEEPEYKKYLKETDGIGTPATRAAIITELKRKEYLAAKGKKIVSTELGQRLLTLVPPLIKNPVLTAIFERKLKEVEQGKMPLGNFIEEQQKFVLGEIEKQKAKLKKPTA